MGGSAEIIYMGPESLPEERIPNRRMGEGDRIRCGLHVSASANSGVMRISDPGNAIYGGLPRRFQSHPRLRSGCRNGRTILGFAWRRAGRQTEGHDRLYVVRVNRMLPPPACLFRMREGQGAHL